LLIKDLFTQVKNITPLLSIIYVILFGLLLMVYFMAEHYRIPLGYLTRDPASILHGRPYVGIISNIGILFWSSAAAISFFVSIILFKSREKKMGTFLFFSALLTSVLLLDDLFMLHENVFPKYLLIPQNLVHAGYFSLVSVYLFKFRSVIFQTEYIILSLALVFFGLSVFCDIFLPSSNIELLFEDGFKLFGIITWFIFFIRTSFFQIQEIINR